MNLDFNKETFVLFDGAMGTMLQRHGLQSGQKPEAFNIIHPDVVQRIHEEYINAGSAITTTNTFGANEIRLRGSGLEVEDVVKQAVGAARRAAGERPVALDLGPTGEFIEPLGDLTFERACDIFARQVAAGVNSGVDLILIETFSDLVEAKAAITATKAKSSLPIFCTFTFQEEGRTFMGHDIKTVVKSLEALGVDVLGANCSVGPEGMLHIIEEIKKCTALPVIVQPNAGLPEIKDGSVKYNVMPEQFAYYMKQMADMGVKFLGGCCGTDPDYIRAVKEILKR